MTRSGSKGPDDFDQHEAYRAAREMSRFIDALESRFPPDDLAGIYARLRQSVLEVGAGIAEGFGRDGSDASGRLSARTREEVLGRLAALRHYVLTCRDRYLLDDAQVAQFDALYERVRAGCSGTEGAAHGG